ncbi:MAG: hypothetical protein KGS61_04875, partial [Verrucomicrobia bacterium]|nr:hypothetical protein [Verrucomicrobiota bacterium]
MRNPRLVTQWAALFSVAAFLTQTQISAHAATVADWTFEEGVPGAAVTNIVDDSGNGHNGSIVWGSPTYVQSGPGAQGNISIRLPSSSGFRPQDSADFNFPNQFTLEVEFRPGTNNAGWRYLIGDFISNGPDVLGLAYRSDPSSIGMGPLVGPLAVPFPLDGQPHHVAAVYMNQTLTLYLDGQARSSTNINLGPTFALAGQAMRLCVGSDYNDGWPFDGIIDRVRISNQALSPQQFFYAASATNGGIPLVVSTYAGSTSGYQDGFRTNAKFDGGISDMKFDAQGRLWLLEASANGYTNPGPSGERVRMIDANGVITSIAGGPSGLVDGPASVARFGLLQSCVFDSAGNLFMVDRANSRIRKLDRSGNVSTFAGSSAGYLDGVGTNAQFNVPYGIAIDANDNLYVGDWFNLRIRQITPQGQVTTFSGTGARGNQDGNRLSATYGGPRDLAMTKDGILYVADWANGTIRRIDASGLVSTFASNLTYDEDISVDAADNVYVSTGGNHTLNKFRPDGTLAWSIGGTIGYLDGPASTAEFEEFGHVMALSDGSLLVGDEYRIRQITIGATAPPSIIGDGIPDAWRLQYFGTNFVNNPQAAANADPDHDGADNYQEYLAGTDPVNSNSAPVLPAIVSTYAGAAGGDQDGYRTTARFDGSITDLKFDRQGRAWLLESSVSGDLQRPATGGQRIRILDTNGVVTTLTGSTNGWADGPLSQALFSIPNGLAFDSAGNAFIADQGNNRIRKI